jgi:poly(A)-specific ribonuclease
LRVAKLSTEEQEAREAEKKQAEMDNITKNVGFSKVIRKISQSNKLVVGHNMLLDVSLTVNQFVDELPPTLAEFKVLVQATFPNLIDTKLMASSHPFREHISSTVLYDLVKRVQSDPFTLPEVKKLTTKGAVGYDVSDRKRHEAGFDAYVTGLSFLGMSQYLGVLHNPKKRRVLPDSPVVMPFLNKLFLMRMLDITYLNISGTDLTPSRSHVFHVTCPDTATGKNIQNWFSQFGPVQIWWRSETSLFVSLNDKEQSSFVIANIESRPGYKVIPFEQYQKQQAEKKRPLLSRSPDREEKDAAPASPKAFPGSGEQQKKRPKTENKGSTQVKQLFHEPTWN